jgi:hypothetical protein
MAFLCCRAIGRLGCGSSGHLNSFCSAAAYPRPKPPMQASGVKMFHKFTRHHYCTMHTECKLPASEAAFHWCTSDPRGRLYYYMLWMGGRRTYRSSMCVFMSHGSVLMMVNFDTAHVAGSHIYLRPEIAHTWSRVPCTLVSHVLG